MKWMQTQPLKRIPLLKYFSKCQKQNEKIKLDGNNVCMIKKMFTKCQEKIDSKKAIGHEKIISGIVLILFGIGGIIFGVKVYHNQNFVQSCNFISGSTNQSNANTGLPCISIGNFNIKYCTNNNWYYNIGNWYIEFLSKGLKIKKYKNSLNNY